MPLCSWLVYYQSVFLELRVCTHSDVLIKVKSMQRSGTEATRSQIQPSKPKWEITKIKNSQNIKRTYGQLSEQLFPRRLSLSNPNRTKMI